MVGNEEFSTEIDTVGYLINEHWKSCDCNTFLNKYESNILSKY